MNPLKRLFLLVKEVGIVDLVSYSLYQAQLRNGPTRQLTPTGGLPPFPLLSEMISPNYCWASNWKNLKDGFKSSLLKDEISLLQQGSFRRFFHEPQSLQFGYSSQSKTHWIDVNEEYFDDIKMEWEPARFIWSLPLAAVYHFSGNESDAELFWQKFDDFIHYNPVNCGPNWVSAQEVAIRAIMWIITASVFKTSPASTSQRLETLTTSIRQHVERILPTLTYARSQHNNHILSESMCLMLAGDYLIENDARALKWRAMGEKDFNRALLRQLEDDGTYSQHSTNYHRLMLQLSLLYHARMRQQNRPIPQKVLQKLAAATRWMITQVDPISGRAPNLGHNDGSLLLPFGCAEYRDYRPTIQAASMAFLGQPCLPSGDWDELPAWMGLQPGILEAAMKTATSTAVHKVGTEETWGTLRAVKFRNRPAHADQLHVDLWWQGINIARDAGTFSYNLPTPWQNALDRTAVHNTITINGTDQMQRMSRFLWLDHAQARLLQKDENTVTANHNGYRRFGIIHERMIQFTPSKGFTIRDRFIKKKNSSRNLEFCLHWLLPDWQWQLIGNTFVLHGAQFTINLFVTARSESTGQEILAHDISVIRAGKTMSGKQTEEIMGWESDTYGEKHPVVSYLLKFSSPNSIEITSKWEFIDAKR